LPRGDRCAPHEFQPLSENAHRNNTRAYIRGTKVRDPSRHFHAQFLANELSSIGTRNPPSLCSAATLITRRPPVCASLPEFHPAGTAPSKRKRFAAAGGAGCDVTLSLPDPGNETPATTITHEANIFPAG